MSKKGRQIRKKEIFGIKYSKQANNQGFFNMVFKHLEGRKIFRGSQDFSYKFLGREPKKFENPWVKV